MIQDKLMQLERYADLATLQHKDRLLKELGKEKDVCDRKIRVRMNGKHEDLQVLGICYCNPFSTGARPFKGGIRYHQNVTLDLLRVLALDMVEKCALAQLPFGGAKFGIPIDPYKLSKPDLREITEKATEQLLLKNILGPDNYVPGPDMGTNSETMFWIYNRVAELNSLAELANVTAVVTGKPIENDGCPGREDATSRGLLILLREYLKLSKVFPSKPSIAVQGFGNVGMNIVRLIGDLEQEFNFCDVHAVCDVGGGLYNSAGLDIPDILRHYKEHKTFADYPLERATQISPEQLLLLPVDILIPAAIENQITENNADALRAKMICEGGNETITVAAQKILDERKLPVIPGIAANVGGVTVSYFEWRRNRGERRHIIDAEDDFNWVKKELRGIMVNIINRIYQKSRAANLSLLESAHILALETIHDQLRMKHGWD